MKKYLFPILFLVSIVFMSPTIVYAQQTVSSTQQTECEKLLEQIKNNGGGRAAALPQYCNTNSIYSKVVGLAYYFIGIAAVISLMYGGYLYMTASSNDSQRTKGKNVIIWTLSGIAVAILASVIVAAVINLVVDNKFF